MSSVCFYFQVHQPFRIRRYSVFDNDPFYFDNEANEEICRKVADKCYIPATRRILDLIKRHDGRFRVSYSISGVALEQFEAWTPEVIELFQECAQTGAVEFIAETSHHSLSFLFSKEEFQAQIAEQEARVERLFGARPTIFRNTELIYNNDVGRYIAEMGRHRAVLCEGIDSILAPIRSPNYVYVPPGGPETPANGGGTPATAPEELSTLG